METLAANHLKDWAYFQRLYNWLDRTKQFFQPNIHIRSGYLKGGERLFSEGVIKIGAGSESDLVLVDEKISEQSFELRHIRTFIFSSVEIASINDKIIVNDKKSLFPGSSVFCQLPVNLNVAGVKLLITEPEFVSKKTLYMIASVLFFLVFLFSAGTLITQNRIERNYTNQQNIFENTVDKSENGKQQSFRFDADLLRQKITESGLDTQIVVSEADSGNEFFLRGIITEGSVSNWRLFNRWIDSLGVNSKVSSSVTVEPIDSYAAMISGISETGGKKRVLLKNNQVLNVGDKFVSGWVIQEISMTFVKIRKSDFTHTISLQN